jgi:hypothetical protein
MTLYRVTIQSKFFDIFGVQLRESLKKHLAINGFCGEISNLKNKDFAELLLKAPVDYSKEKTEQIILDVLCGENEILRDSHFSLDKDEGKKVPKLYLDDKDKIIGYITSRRDKWQGRFSVTANEIEDEAREEELEGMRIIRDNETQESAWALQGAGKVFQISSKIQKQVSEQIKERDKNKTIILLLSLHYEINRNRDVLSESIGGSAVTKIVIPVIQAFLTNPPPWRIERNFLDHLANTHYALIEAKETITDKEQIKSLRGDLEILREMVKQKLEGLGEKV